MLWKNKYPEERTGKSLSEHVENVFTVLMLELTFVCLLKLFFFFFVLFRLFIHRSFGSKGLFGCASSLRLVDNF